MEGLPRARARHAQHDRVGGRTGGRARRRVARDGARRPTRAPRGSAANRCRRRSRPASGCGSSISAGYEYTRTTSDVSGALMTRYDESKPQIWKIPLRDEVLPELTSSRLAAATSFRPRMPHGSRESCVSTASRSARVLASRLEGGDDVETFRADKAIFSARSTEGHQRLTLAGRVEGPRRATSTRGRCSCRSRSPRRAWSWPCWSRWPPRLARRVGRLQHRVRAEGVHGALRSGRGGPRAARRRSCAGGGIPQEARCRAPVRGKFRRTARVLLSPASFVGRAPAISIR